MSEFTSEQVKDLVKALVGGVQPHGDSYIDEQKYKNLLKLGELCVSLCHEIELVVKENVGSMYLASVRESVDLAVAFMKDIHESFGVLLSWEELKK